MDSGYTVDDATSPPLSFVNEGRPIDCWEFMILARIGYLIAATTGQFNSNVSLEEYKVVR